MTDFILDSACHAAEQTLLDQPPKDNAGLRDLFERKAPWDAAWRWARLSPCWPSHHLDDFDCGKPASN